MQIEARVKPKRSTVADNVCHCLEGSLVGIAGSNLVALGMRAVFSVRQENGNLGTQFREFKRACEQSRQFRVQTIRNAVSATKGARAAELTCNQCDTGASGRTGCPKAGN